MLNDELSESKAKNVLLRTLDKDIVRMNPGLPEPHDFSNDTIVQSQKPKPKP